MDVGNASLTLLQETLLLAQLGAHHTLPAVPAMPATLFAGATCLYSDSRCCYRRSAPVIRISAPVDLGSTSIMAGLDCGCIGKIWVQLVQDDATDLAA